MHRKTLSIIIPALNEEEHVEKLIRSIYGQDYRPIEVVVVDDESSDSTLEIVSRLSQDLGSDEFVMLPLERSDYSRTRGPAAARNVGIIHSNGEYVLLIDADCLVVSTGLLSEIARQLETNPIVGYVDSVLVDNWLEYNQMLDGGNPPFATSSKWSHLAFRREVIDGHLFDTNLGVQEDADFQARLGISAKDVFVVNKRGSIHLPHTLMEYWRQRFWAGRTSWLYLKKHPEATNLATSLLRAMPFLDLLSSFVVSLMRLWYGVLLLLPWVALVAYHLARFGSARLSRLVYLLMRFSFGSCAYACGLVKGSYDLFIKRKVDPSRGK